MSSKDKHIYLLGRVSIGGDIFVVTGLRIGGRPTGIDIGGVDNIVLRNPLNHEPYIPGSSLKGKMRSLLERADNRILNYQVGTDENPVYIHSCARAKQSTEYDDCDVCHIFGLPGEGTVKADSPTRLLVRDVALKRESLEGRVPTFTEIKWEAAIDRITSAANPRQMERVPAGAVFKNFDLTYSLYEVDGKGRDKEVERLLRVFEAMQLLEEDYLGGLGSRGSGKIQFQNIKIFFRRPNEKAQPYKEESTTLDKIDRNAVKTWVDERFKTGG
jgi:CRISPR-associated protein Csm3